MGEGYIEGLFFAHPPPPDLVPFKEKCVGFWLVFVFFFQYFSDLCAERNLLFCLCSRKFVPSAMHVRRTVRLAVDAIVGAKT